MSKKVKAFIGYERTSYDIGYCHQTFSDLSEAKIFYLANSIIGEFDSFEEAEKSLAEPGSELNILADGKEDFIYEYGFIDSHGEYICSKTSELWFIETSKGDWRELSIKELIEGVEAAGILEEEKYLLTICANWADEIDFVSQHIVKESEIEKIEALLEKEQERDRDEVVYYGSNEFGSSNDLNLSYQKISKEAADIFSELNSNSHDFLGEIYDF